MRRCVRYTLLFAVVVTGCGPKAEGPTGDDDEVAVDSGTIANVSSDNLNGSQGLNIETALAAHVLEPVDSTRARFKDLSVPHTEVMISDYIHQCDATSNTGRSLYIELFSANSPDRSAAPGKYAYWQPTRDESLPGDSRFVAVLSETRTADRRDEIALRGEVEVVELGLDGIELEYKLTFAGGGTVSGHASTSLCDAWGHSWLGVPRASPSESTN